MLSRFRKAAALGLFAAISVSASVYAAGMWPDLPMIGQSSYCASNVTGVLLPGGQGPFGIFPGNITGTGNVICQHVVPAGPTAFTGSEFVPTDLIGLGASSAGPQTTAVTSILNLGNGPVVTNAVAGSFTIANNTAFEVVTVQETAAVNFTLPATPVGGQEVRITDTGGTSAGGTITVLANTGQTCVPATCASLAASTATVNTFGFVWNAPAATWYRFQ